MAADVVCTILPIATGGGLAIKAIFKSAKAADKAVDAARAVDKVADAAKAADKLDNVTDLSKIVDNLTDIGKRPIENHHFATNKSKTFTDAFEEITEKYGLDLDDAWNIEPMPHQGRHTNKYHEFVYDTMNKIEDALGGCGVNCKDDFTQMFTEKVKKPVMNNPEMLRKQYWRNLEF